MRHFKQHKSKRKANYAWSAVVAYRNICHLDRYIATTISVDIRKAADKTQIFWKLQLKSIRFEIHKFAICGPRHAGVPQTIGTTSATTLEFQLLMLVLRPPLANTRTFALFSGSKWRTVANIYVRVVQVHTYAVHEGR